MLRTSAAIGLMAAFAAVPAGWSQIAVSAQSGMVHYVEGRVLLDQTPVRIERGQFPMIEEGQTLETESGRAEVLLAPGVFLRLDRYSSVRMMSTDLADTKFEVLSGVAMVEAAEIRKENRLAVWTGDSWALIEKEGLYEFNADEGRLRVFDGRAKVWRGEEQTELKKGREVSFSQGQELVATKFDKRVKDRNPLYLWSSNRAGILAMANLSLVRSTQNSRRGNSMWAYYPTFGLYTFLPGSGYFTTPFGWSYYSPGWYWTTFSPRYSGWGGGAASSGWTRMGSSSGAASGGGFGGGGGYRAGAPSGAAPRSSAGTARGGGRGR
jgi:hypothetical protein